MFPKIGVPRNGWFIMQNPIKMDDLRVPLFLETPIFTLVYIRTTIFGSYFFWGSSPRGWKLGHWFQKQLHLSQEIQRFHTVDGWNPANQLRLVVFPIIYRVSYILGGAGFQPSTVLLLISGVFYSWFPHFLLRHTHDIWYDDHDLITCI